MIFPELGFLVDVDIELLRWINGFSGRLPVLDSAMTIVSSSFFWLAIGTVILLLALKSGNASTLSRLIFALISLGVTDLISFEVIKPLVARERPCWSLEGINLVLGACGGSYGFTSNHAANSAAFAFAIVSSKLFNWPTTVLVVFSAGLVGLSRVYLGVHYPGDVLGGFCLGILVTSLLSVLRLNVVSDLISKRSIHWTQLVSRKPAAK